MKKILFLTNKDNDAFEEDAELIDFLKSNFEIVVSHPRDCLPILRKVEGIVIRNIWPTYEYQNEWKVIAAKIRETKIPTYNLLTGKGDMNGKGYLVELFKSGYSVMPSVDSIKDIGVLGNIKYYWIKPTYGCDGFGSGKYTREELATKNLVDYIIQPYIEFTSEPSFYYIDGIFSHAITMPNRLTNRDIQLYTPTQKELDFAQVFVDWNHLECGIQRIDMIRTKEGELLLNEIEDLCPYLCLDEVDYETKKSFLDKIRSAIIERFK